MIHVAYSPKYLNWNLGDNHPTNPVRAQLAVRLLKDSGANLHTIDPDGMYPTEEYFDLAREIHDHEYVERVKAGISGEWDGFRPSLGDTAALMFGGTVALTRRMLHASGPGVYFNPQGAKHHAQYAQSSGFCVFNDMAWAANTLTAAGNRVVYVDWDAHHGDGVEEMLRDHEDILTISVHDSTIFPGSGNDMGDRWVGYMNYPLPSEAGDPELRWVVDEIRETLLTVEPDVILLACGADGLAGDPLTTLNYTQEGLDHASRMIGSVARQLGSSVLIGGAGGYQPYDEVPEHWSRCVLTVDKWLNL